MCGTDICQNILYLRLLGQTDVGGSGHFLSCHPFLVNPLHRGAFCQFPFQWIYYYGSNKSTRKETGKMHLCALCCGYFLIEINFAKSYSSPNLLYTPDLVATVARKSILGQTTVGGGHFLS